MSFSTNLINTPQLMNKPSVTSLKRVQATENNPPHKAKISSFKLKVTIGDEDFKSGTLFEPVERR